VASGTTNKSGTKRRVGGHSAGLHSEAGRIASPVGLRRFIAGGPEAGR
jgi:hypothetical protein